MAEVIIVSHVAPYFSDLFRLDDRIALVTGAAGRLGREMAIGLAEAGAHVILNGRNPSALEKLCFELKDRGFSAEVAALDITQDIAVNVFFRNLHVKHGRLDILVNNAYNGETASMDSIGSKDFYNSYDVAVVAAFRLITQAKSLLLDAVTHTGHASVINVTSMYASISPDPSIYGSSGMNNPPFYGAAKAALLQLTRHIACHWGPHGIRVNAISPGPFPPPDVIRRFPKFRRELEKRVPLGRVGHPRELMGAVLFLASDASTYVTGSNLAIDGGWTAW